jgi:hypothetical protein
LCSASVGHATLTVANGISEAADTTRISVAVYIVDYPECIDEREKISKVKQESSRISWTFLLYNLYMTKGVSHAGTELGLFTCRV